MKQASLKYKQVEKRALKLLGVMEAPEQDDRATLDERDEDSAPLMREVIPLSHGTTTGQSKTLKSLIIFTCLLLAIWGFIDVGRSICSLVNKIVSLQTCDTCGDTPEDAVARGCRYHRIINAWVPKECYDEELVSEFDEASKAWSFYKDQQGAIAIPYEDVPFYRGPKYTTWEQHVTHCYYWWLLHYRGFALGKARLLLETEAGAEAHIRHCGKAFTNVPDELKHRILTVLKGKNSTGEGIWEE